MLLTKETRKATLQILRSRLRGNVQEDGILLVFSSRLSGAAEEVENIVKTIGGEMVRRYKVNKTVASSNRVWRVEFTISNPVDAYLKGSMTLRELGKWEEDQASREAEKGSREADRLLTKVIAKAGLNGLNGYMPGWSREGVARLKKLGLVTVTHYKACHSGDVDLTVAELTPEGRKLARRP